MMLVCCQCQVVPIFTCKHGYVISHLKHFEYEAVASNEAFQVHGDAWSALYSLSNCSKVLRTCGGFPLLLFDWFNNFCSTFQSNWWNTQPNHDLVSAFPCIVISQNKRLS